jgi:hypothetical protein
VEPHRMGTDEEGLRQRTIESFFTPLNFALNLS